MRTPTRFGTPSAVQLRRSPAPATRRGPGARPWSNPSAAPRRSRPPSPHDPGPRPRTSSNAAAGTKVTPSTSATTQSPADDLDATHADRSADGARLVLAGTGQGDGGREDGEPVGLERGDVAHARRRAPARPGRPLRRRSSGPRPSSRGRPPARRRPPARSPAEPWSPPRARPGCPRACNPPDRRVRRSGHRTRPGEAGGGPPAHPTRPGWPNPVRPVPPPSPRGCSLRSRRPPRSGAGALDHQAGQAHQPYTPRMTANMLIVTQVAPYVDSPAGVHGTLGQATVATVAAGRHGRPAARCR